MVLYNMKYFTVHPTKTYINVSDPKAIESLKEELTYTNKSILFQVISHKKLGWFRKKDPIGWDFRLKDLQSKLKSCLLYQEKDKYWVRTGLVPHILGQLDEVHTQLEPPKHYPLPWKTIPKFKPYQYQSQAVDELLKVRHGNVSLPTGTGKSHILLMLSKQIGKGVVIVTPSKSIFNELLTNFQNHLGKQVVGGYGDGKKDIDKPITIAIGKSLTMLKPDTPQYTFFRKKTAMLVDESHTFAANQLENVCHGVLNNALYRIFVSATQTRNDGTEKLLQSIIGETVFEMSLSDAISDKYLCPLNFHIIETFSPSSVTIKDPIKSKRTHFLYNENIAKIAAKIANASWRSGKESTLILVEELKQIKMIVDKLEVPFAYVHAGSKKDAEKFGLTKVKLQEQVDKFNNGEIKVLIGTSCISTGTNMFPTHNTINWMGGSSEIVTKQGPMGRSTRILSKSDFSKLHKDKPYSKIFDFKVEEQHMLNKQLEKRISWYKEANGYVKYSKVMV